MDRWKGPDPFHFSEDKDTVNIARFPRLIHLVCGSVGCHHSSDIVGEGLCARVGPGPPSPFAERTRSPPSGATVFRMTMAGQRRRAPRGPGGGRPPEPSGGGHGERAGLGDGDLMDQESECHRRSGPKRTNQMASEGTKNPWKPIM